MAEATQTSTDNPNMVPQGQEAGVGFMDYAMAPVDAVWGGYMELMARGADLLGAEETAASWRSGKDIGDYFSSLGDTITQEAQDAYVSVRYPNISEMQAQYPEVFEKMQARMDENGNMDGESLARLENLIAQNPENAHEVFSTIQYNPEFLTLAGDIDTMMTPETMEQVFQNPELLQVHHLSQLQQQYPEVFADLRTSMTSNGPVDLQDMHALEQKIAANPENAVQVFDTLEANPDLLAMGGAMGGIMTADNIDAIFENPDLLDVDQILQLKQEFPEVFDKLEAKMSANGPLDLEQINSLEKAIEENPENAREIMQTFKDNPEYADFALEKFGGQIGKGGLEDVIRNPSVVTDGAEIFQITQNFGAELKALMGSFLTNGKLDLQNFDFENFFESLMNIFSKAGEAIQGSDIDLARFGQGAFNLSGLEDKLDDLGQPAPDQAPQGPQQPPPGSPAGPQEDSPSPLPGQ